MNELNVFFRKKKLIDENKLLEKSKFKAEPKKDSKVVVLSDLFAAFHALTDEGLSESAVARKSAVDLKKSKLGFGDATDQLLGLLGSGATIDKIAFEVKAHLEGNPQSKKIIIELLNVLLLIDSELEQRLMLEYLYAAYSIETEQKDITLKQTVLEWQQLLIGIAREEMGHLITVQNVRKSLGLNMYFQVNYLSELTNIFPYISKLEPFSKTSLAKYIFAESPKNWINSDDPDAKKVKELIDAEIKSEKGEHKNAVSSLANYFEEYGVPISALFKVVLLILEHFTSETDFFIPSVTEQARAEQWNRGYSSDERIIVINGREIKIPASHVLVETAMTRWECIEAIKVVAEQGEDASDDTIDKETHTHFNRFLKIFKLWDIMGDGKEFQPSKKMATNPSTVNSKTKIETTKIEDPITLKWAKLLNVRYSLLIAFIEHSFNIEANFANQASSLKGLIINGSFGEMYHLKAISNVLSGLPMAKGNTTLFAGPPFEMHPLLLERYSKVLNGDSKISNSNFEDLYVEFIKESNALIKEIPDHENNRFLNNLQNNDRELLALLLPAN